MSTINRTAHGLVASQRVVFSSLVGGAPIDPDVVYWVLTAGLTANAFQISETQEGTPLTFATVTSANMQVVPETTTTDTFGTAYTAISDPTVAMAPPTTPPTPSAPTVASALVSGIVRLQITLNDTAEAKVRVWEVQVTGKFDGSGNPDWTTPTKLALPEGATSISMPALGSTVYNVRVGATDVYGQLSAYSTVVAHTTLAGSDALSAALASLANDVADGIITTTKIADGSISTPKLQAGAVTAQVLAATIVLASLIKTAVSGTRIEIDVDGIRLYASDESLLVRIPTNGDPVFVKGQVSADSLVSQTAASFRTAISFDASSVATLQNGTAAPTIAPTISASVDYLALGTSPVSSPVGIAYDSGAGTFWLALDPASGHVAAEYNASTGALVRYINATGSTSTVFATLGNSTHVADTAQAFDGSTSSHITTPLTIPAGLTNVFIDSVAAYFAGHNGSCVARVGVWSTSNVGLAESVSFTAASGGATGVGNSVKYSKALTTPLSVTSGTTYRCGFRHTSSSEGFQFDRDDGSGKTTYAGDGTTVDGTGWSTINSSSKPNVCVNYHYSVDTRLETQPNIGIATDGTSIFILDATGVIWKYDRTTGAYITNSAVQTAITGTKANAGMFYDATATELIITTTTGTGAGVFPKFVRVVPSTLAVSATVYSAAAGQTFSGTTDVFRGGARVADALNAGAATYWISTTSAVYAYTFSGTAATQTANRDFGTAATVNDGLTFDGTVFRGFDNASPTKIWKFSAWDYTTANPTTLWVGYAWYDSNATGGTHETAMGPRTSISVRRHERVQVQNPAVQLGGTDDPNNVRIYFLQNATDTGAGTFWLQITDALTSRFATSYTASGTHDGTGTAFPAGTPAELKSAAAGWDFKGDGSATLGLTATGGKPPVRNVYAAGTTWTKPAGLAFIEVEVQAGGGGSGGVAATAATTAAAAGAGGGGGYSKKIFSAAALASLSTATVTVGAGGLAGVAGANAGGTGGTSSFAGTGISTVTALGGAGGNGSAAAVANGFNVGGAGGTSSNGDVNAAGGEGAPGYWANLQPSPNIVGGGSHWGGGGSGPASIVSGGLGHAGSGFGGGAGGSTNGVSQAARAGAAGAPGLVIVTEYYLG